MESNIAEGFVQDAERLVKDFAEEIKLDLNVFADIWKKHHFSKIFLGRPNFRELSAFTNQIFAISMELFLKETVNMYEHVGYLYLLYALFRYQPIKPPVKIRVTMDDLDEIVKLRDKAESTGDMHTLFAIRYLFRNACGFVCTTTLMGPLLNISAVDIDLSPNPPEDVEDAVDKACKVQRDIETCFQFLKIQKRISEEAVIRIGENNVLQGSYSVTHNIPYKVFLDSLDPFPPPETSMEKEKDSIGNRRALLKAAAFTKTINRAHRSLRGKPHRGHPGRPRNMPVEPVETKKKEPESPKRQRGQKREKMFKKKYLFQYEE